MKTTLSLWVRRCGWVLVVALLAGPAAGQGQPQERPRNVVLMIGDGMGVGYTSLARLVAGRPLALDGMLVGQMKTGSADAAVTDSAAAATAIATGRRTLNKAVGVDAQGRAMRTLLDCAKDRGMLAGVVATCRITHATPAAFTAHAASRYEESAIAAQQVEQPVDLWFGGGLKFLLPEAAGGERTDGRDLLSRWRERGYAVATSPAEWREHEKLPMAAILWPDSRPYEIDAGDGDVPLAEATGRALALLSAAAGERGFVLVIESSLIDWAGHRNDAGAAVRETLAFDEAVAAALAFARADGNTLVLATADHETGGLSVGGGGGGYTVRTEAIEAQPASLDRMLAQVRSGQPWQAVFDGVLGPAQVEAIEAAAAEQPEFNLGRALVKQSAAAANVVWATHGHTAADVNVYAFGPGSGDFAGLLDNIDIARRLAALLGATLPAEAEVVTDERR